MATPSDNFEITPRAAFSRCNELKFKNLFLYHTYSGPNATQKIIIKGDSSGLGETCVNNWLIYDGLQPDGKVVARAQGLHISAGSWYSAFCILFENERFKGSTLQVLGVPVEEGDWAIVGGTGEFSMATGVIHKKVHERLDHGNVIELTVHAFCPVLKEPPKPLRYGPWGSNIGTAYDIKEAPKRLESITLCRGQVVDTLEFSYTDHAGATHTIRMGPSYFSPQKIQLQPNEYVKEMSGTHNSYYNEPTITSLRFTTNITSYGPYGAGGGTGFSISAPDGYSIVGFFGYGTNYLRSIGVYVNIL